MASCLYYSIADSSRLFAEFIIDRRREANRCEGALGEIFHATEHFGAEELLELGAAKVGDGKDFFNFEAGLAENFFNIFGMIIIKTVRIKILEMGDVATEGVDF